LSSGKKKLAIFSLLLLLVAIPATSYLVFRQQELRSNAVAATSLSFDPITTSKTVGEAFTLNVAINTATNSVSGAELHISYDTSKLQAVSIDSADPAFLPLVLVQGSVGGGFAFITLGSQPTTPKQGSGNLATITFKAIQSTGGAPTLVKFTTDTRVAGTGEIGNVLATQPQSAQITINDIAPTGVATPTPTSIPTGVPTPTHAAGTGGGGGGVATPTPTPTRNVGIGVTTAFATPTLQVGIGVASSTPVLVKTTANPIPVTADIAPTAILTGVGAMLFIAGIAAMLIL
jgi:hypothetical protein